MLLQCIDSGGDGGSGRGGGGGAGGRGGGGREMVVEVTTPLPLF